MSFGCGRKAEYQDQMRRTVGEQSKWCIQPITFFPSYNSARHCTVVLPNTSVCSTRYRCHTAGALTKDLLNRRLVSRRQGVGSEGCPSFVSAPWKPCSLFTVGKIKALLWDEVMSATPASLNGFRTLLTARASECTTRTQQGNTKRVENWIVLQVMLGQMQCPWLKYTCPLVSIHSHTHLENHPSQATGGLHCADTLISPFSKHLKGELWGKEQSHSHPLATQQGSFHREAPQHSWRACAHPTQAWQRSLNSIQHWPAAATMNHSMALYHNWIRGP